MLNVLHIEPWVIARQLRHSDGGALVVKLYAIRQIRAQSSGCAAASGETCASFATLPGMVRGSRRKDLAHNAGMSGVSFLLPPLAYG
jgi:hypothetical protein